MSDIEILLRELIEKVDKLEHKVDNLTKKVKTTINMNYGRPYETNKQNDNKRIKVSNE